MTTIYPAIKAGDTTDGPRLRLVGRDQTPANLVGATILMHIRGEPSLPVVIAEAADGIVYCPRGTLAPTTNQEVARFDVEFEVTYAGGTVQTFPEEGQDKVTVWIDLDN